MRVQTPPGQQHHGISLGAPKGRAWSCITTCSAQSAWPATLSPTTLTPQPRPSPRGISKGSCLPRGCRPAQRRPPASAPGPAADRQQLTSTLRFLWADAHSSGTLHSHSFNPGRSALLLSPSRGGENCCKETLSDLSGITELVQGEPELVQGEPGTTVYSSEGSLPPPPPGFGGRGCVSE